MRVWFSDGEAVRCSNCDEVSARSGRRWKPLPPSRHAAALSVCKDCFDVFWGGGGRGVVVSEKMTWARCGPWRAHVLKLSTYLAAVRIGRAAVNVRVPSWVTRAASVKTNFFAEGRSD